ncbi:autotransporter strand-loop-strand O-heptosyltransferase [Pelosinus propionicus]|uniref:Autotransporter strand-loop-strand O-heptosyltransferase n=1 Tax=Pelosinus propionicus DSM 13327 TaxID=1123291 RepID=A0A1I4LS75_9FIRM|nr:autotransporter strand-loop-strand O-heptosyltransferase [Pelosinus propionicus]SFL93696.1 autotransporter strand-loop-strand O-heptosyltransferase [Pelosinus propionicus DSM 13327]
MNHQQVETEPSASDQPAPTQNPSTIFSPGELTCKTNIEGLAFDFNYGARVKIPAGNWRLRIIDNDAFLTLYDAQVSDTLVFSSKKYYVNFRLEIYHDEKLVFRHDYSPSRKKILMKFSFGTLEDISTWFPYVHEFKYKYNCEVYCAMAPELAELFKPTYPDLHFIDSEERPDDIYASYYLGISFPSDGGLHRPLDWRIVSLQRFIPYLLGLKTDELRPQTIPKPIDRLIAEPYVCIAAQTSVQAKCWNNPIGWLCTIKHLKEKGYRVLCIDKETYQGSGSCFGTIPYGAEDFTDWLPLPQRASLLYHTDFLVSMSNGLSWLAWCLGKPVVLISGFRLPNMEFSTPYRVINYHACSCCFRDSRFVLVHQDFSWCPRHKNTERQFECTRLITSGQVNAAIDRLMTNYQLQPQSRKSYSSL